MTVGFSAHHAGDDTVVARATAAGVGAIAVIRMSGPQALAIAGRAAPGCDLSVSHRMRRVLVRSAVGEVLDDGLIVAMHAPHSYTGEETVEFYGHGSPAVVQAVLGRFVDLGARRAEAGEFSYRAFLQGRLDLSQAEAVGDLIASRTDTERRVALRQLAGGLTLRITGWCSALEQVLATWRAEYDFPEYEHGAIHGFTAAHGEELARLLEEMQNLRRRARLELFSPRSIVLAGAPNVGKSTLLNTLLGGERVLVDDAPGTTRDAVEVEVVRIGERFRVWDTAGVRQQQDGLELRGAQLGLERARGADVVWWLVEADIDRARLPPVDLDCLLVGAKADTVPPALRAEFEAHLNALGFVFAGWVSGESGEGIDSLFAGLGYGPQDEASATGIEELQRAAPDDVPIVVRERHVHAIEGAIQALQATLAAEARGESLDVLTIELEVALAALGGILGRQVDVAVLDEIFAQFCIGK